MRYLELGYWKYIFSSQRDWSKLPYKFPSLSRIFCRLKSHPNGPIFFNAMGDEPDYHCIDCGESI